MTQESHGDAGGSRKGELGQGEGPRPSTGGPAQPEAPAEAPALRLSFPTCLWVVGTLRL